MKTQRVKVRVRIPVQIDVFASETDEDVIVKPSTDENFLDFEVVVEVDAGLKGYKLEAAARRRGGDYFAQQLGLVLKQ